MVRVTMLVVLLLALTTDLAAQRSPGVSAQSPVKSAGATQSLAQQVDAMDSDLQRMRSLLAQMQSNLAFVTNTTSPLKHQFELEIEMWTVLIARMQQRVDAMRASSGAENETAPPETGDTDNEGPGSRYHRLLDNAVLRAFSIELPARAEAPIYQNVHDVLWVAISSGTLAFRDRARHENSVALRPGDTRFFRRDSVVSARNTSAAPLRAAVIELKKVGLVSSCGCEAEIEKAVCGCGGDLHLPNLWAVALGEVTAAGTTLAPGQSSQGASPRGNMLIVAVTRVELHDETGSASVQLAPGQVAWVASGLHQFRNVAAAPARFVSLEF